MRYMMLLYTNQGEWAARGSADQQAVVREHTALMQELQKSGQYETCDALETVQNATTVRVRAGKTHVTDGPFAETKEQLGGYYIVEARDLDDAIAIAARIPDARMGSVEIRPILDLS
jgi:hypothetical protein